MNTWNGSRRELINLLGMSAAFGPGLLAGCSRPNPALKFYGTGTLDIGKTNWVTVTKDTGIELQFTDNGNDVGPVLSQMINGTAALEYDIGGVQGGAEAEMYKAGVILPWDLKQIPMWEKVWDWLKNVPHLNVDGKQIGIPIVVNADSMIYLERETGKVESYAAVFDKKFKGRTSMEDSWMNSVIFTAIYMKENNIEGMGRIKTPGDLEEFELGTVMEFLKKHKRDGQFLKFWSGWQEGVELVKSRKVAVMTGWEPIVYAAQQQGAIDARYAIPNEGYEGWSNNLVLHKSVKDHGTYEAAHKFADWQLSGWYGCVLGGLRGYMVPTDRCVDVASATKIQYTDVNKLGANEMGTVSAPDAQRLRDHVQQKFLASKGRVYWQNARPKLYKQYATAWTELRSI